MTGLHVEAGDYERFFQRTKDASGKIRTRMRKQVRDSGRKYGDEIVEQGAEKLPHRGGLDKHVASKGRRPTVSLTSTGARLVLGKKKGPQNGRMNEGNLRHPVFWVWWRKGPKRGASKFQQIRHTIGLSKAILSDPAKRDTWKWVQQDIPAGTFTDAAEKYLPAIRDDVARAVTEVLKELG